MSGVGGSPCRLVVCRGCCCGRKKKVPGIDHKAQLERLSSLEDHAARPVPVRVSTCLGICFKRNVVVVQPSSAGRAAGGRPVWFGEVDDPAVEQIDDWVFEGGPGIAPVPAELAGHVTSKDAKKPKKAKKKKKDAKDKKARKKERRRADQAGGEPSAKGKKSGKKDGKKARAKAERADPS